MPIEQLLHEQWGRLLALLVARTRRLDLAEDALAEAFEAAVRTWPREGTPQRPEAWLYASAHRRIIDRLRAEAVAARKEPLLVVQESNRLQDNGNGDCDDLLRLVLLAAHPALAPESGAALTLRLVMGVSTADIARLFLVGESTMAARLTRARKKVVAAGIPFALPDASVLSERLEVVAQVAYLAFTAGYAPGTGPDVLRAEVSGEAIRLVRLVLRQAPGQPTLTALLALMLLQHSRRDARVNSGALVLLPDQDRSLWRTAEIAEGLSLVDTLTTGSAVIGVDRELTASYVLQALIAAEHAQAARADQTRWDRIADLYRQLDALTHSPIVRMNRAVAVAEAGAADAAWDLVADLDDALGDSHRLAAVRAEIALRRGHPAQAYDQFERAITLCGNEPERVQLRCRQQSARLACDGGGSAGKPGE